MKECTFDKGKKCAALVTHDCEKCSFRKTKEELLEGRRKAIALLARLPKEKREVIEDKYHKKNAVKYEL